MKYAFIPGINKYLYDEYRLYLYIFLFILYTIFKANRWKQILLQHFFEPQNEQEANIKILGTNMSNFLTYKNKLTFGNVATSNISTEIIYLLLQLIILLCYLLLLMFNIHFYNKVCFHI